MQRVKSEAATDINNGRDRPYVESFVLEQYPRPGKGTGDSCKLKREGVPVEIYVDPE